MAMFLVSRSKRGPSFKARATYVCMEGVTLRLFEGLSEECT
jgi:hypothetical protein